MPTIFISLDNPNSHIGEVTFAERVIPSSLHNDHYIDQLVERLGWAIIDAEELEADEGVA